MSFCVNCNHPIHKRKNSKNYLHSWNTIDGSKICQHTDSGLNVCKCEEPEPISSVQGEEK